MLFRRVIAGAATGAAVGIFVCGPWEVFVGVSRSTMDWILPLVPLTLAFTLLGASVGSIFSINEKEAEAKPREARQLESTRR